MTSCAVIAFAVNVCMYISLPSLVGAQPYCGNDGDVCQNKLECCFGVVCKKPPHTCGGVCNTESCSGSGTNLPLGMQCDEYDNQCAPDADGSPVPCQRPPSKRCNGICPQCVAVARRQI